jgi:multidrug efflux pump subunit AcrA (membrane-fusion protein)
MTGLRLHHRRASLLSLAIAPFVLPSLSACAKKQDRAPRPAATVSVVPAKRATVPYLIEANGVVTPMQTANVVSQVDGIILSVDFQEGEEVRPGQALFHIDARPYQNAYDAALAVFARDSSNAAHQKVELDRFQKLLDSRVVTQQDLAAQATLSATADATVRADQAAVETAKFNLDNCVVRASIAGKTGGVLLRRGNMVRGGSGIPLVVINQVRPIYVRFAIPSSQLSLVLQYGARGGLPVTAVPGGLAPASPSIDSLAAEAMGNVVQDAPAGPRSGGQSGAGNGGGNGGASGSGAMASAVSGESSGSGFGPPSGPMAGAGGPGGSSGNSRGGRRGGNANANNANGSGTANGATPSVVQQSAIAGDRLTGKLSFIDNAVDTSTATVQLKAVFDNENGRLWAGQFAATSLHLFDEDSALVIPTQAVVTGQRGTYVYVVDQSDTARQRAVVVERTAGNVSIISSGVRDGERVVTDGQARLTPDSPVRLRGPNDVGNAGGNGGGRRGGGRRGGNGGGRKGGTDAAASGSATSRSQ